MEYWVWLQTVLKPGSNKVLPVLEKYGSAKGVFETSYDDLKLSNIFSPRELSVLAKKDISFAKKVLNDCKKLNISAVCINNRHYPELLRQISNPPLVLYFKGNIELLNDEPTVCIVGPREVSPFGKRAAFSLAARLSSGGFTIVSGGAVGSDTAAHKGALAVEGNTVCVLGCGINSTYLKENKPLRDKIAEKGIVISEYFPNQEATRYSFPVRNRIMSGLSHGVVVVEANEKSGALITANLANEQGRDVFVIPGNPTYAQYKGSNKLLRDGARALLDANDVFLEYIGAFPHKIDSEKAYRITAKMSEEKTPEKATKTPVDKLVKQVDEKLKQKTKKIINNDLSKKAEMVYNQLDKPIFMMDEINCTLTANEMLAAITELEIMGYIAALPGGRYELK